MSKGTSCERIKSEWLRQRCTSSEGEEGVAGASLASDFNRQERWKEKSEDKRAPRPYHTRTSAVHDKAGL
ncbi:hypothetical protein [Paenibacillus sp. FSL R5-0473]|uniref:hypothetical protein n=1 Tax=Paenibacillus sp. FSL R5-0473 TaxID=2921642 RepID=UPI0030F833EA